MFLVEFVLVYFTRADIHTSEIKRNQINVVKTFISLHIQFISCWICRQSTNLVTAYWLCCLYRRPKNYYYYYTCLMASFPGQPGYAGTRKVKPACIKMRQEMMGFGDGSGISWAICKQSAPRSRQITTPTPHHSIFTGRMLFLMPN